MAQESRNCINQTLLNYISEGWKTQYYNTFGRCYTYTIPKWIKNQMVSLNHNILFVKLVHTESRVNHKIQLFFFNGVQLIPNGHTQAGFDSGALCLATMATLSLDAVHKTNMQYMLPALKF